MSTYVSNVTVFDGRAVRQKAGVLVSDGLVEWVGAHARAPRAARDATEIEGRSKLLTPGLIDRHVHLCFEGGRRFRLGGEPQARQRTSCSTTRTPWTTSRRSRNPGS